MNKIAWVVVSLLVLTGLGYLVINSKSDDKPQSKDFSSVQSDLRAGAKLLDVRTKEEYDSGHFAGATLFALQDIESGKLPDVARETKIYVYCRSGNRSSQAMDLLNKAGFTNVIDLGGLSDVQKIGGVLTT
ncbi:rhodanese-like domain-containing protein [Candidatus Saccharibacteria bacterium]|nr:rhodanese-like domain-containing protein [Candidatus Saccharibacteria bacterium]NCU40414.1 rhodanese-like domain-containing protein [Candidatus Saccharibacteria bacterium]